MWTSGSGGESLDLGLGMCPMETVASEGWTAALCPVEESSTPPRLLLRRDRCVWTWWPQLAWGGFNFLRVASSAAPLMERGLGWRRSLCDCCRMIAECHLAQHCAAQEEYLLDARCGFWFRWSGVGSGSALPTSSQVVLVVRGPQFA